MAMKAVKPLPVAKRTAYSGARDLLHLKRAQHIHLANMDDVKTFAQKDI